MRRLSLAALPLVGVLSFSIGLAPTVAFPAANSLPPTRLSSSLVSLDNDSERKKLEEKQAAAKKKEAELAAQLEGVKADLVELAVQLERTKAAIPVAQSELASAQQKLAESEREHQSIQARLKIAQTQKAKLQTDIAASEQLISQTQVTIGQIAQQAYRGRKLDTSAWTLLFDSKSLAELALRAEVADTAAQSQNRVIQAAAEARAAASHARTRQEAVTLRIGELEAAAKQAVAAAAAAKQAEQKQLGAIQKLQAQQISQQHQLNGQRAEFEKEIKEQQAAQAEAARKIAQMIAESQNGPNRAITGGIFGAPLSTLNVTSPYGYRTHPLLKTRLLHAGTDFGIGCGSPVYAAQSGTVRLDHNSVGGNVVYVNHGKINGSAWQTAYAHLSAFKTTAGQHVEKGQVIGLVGSTGRSTGCHLHFEVWQNGKTINSYQALVGGK